MEEKKGEAKRADRVPPQGTPDFKQREMKVNKSMPMGDELKEFKHLLEVIEYKELLKRAVKIFFNEGINVVPARADRKYPSSSAWKKYQTTKYPVDKLIEFIETKELPRVGIITGKVSGNLIVIDFDSIELANQFLTELKKSNEELLKKLLGTWVVRTGKGMHFYLKLAKADERLLQTRHYKGIDIQGEGAFVMAPPSFYRIGEFEEIGGIIFPKLYKFEIVEDKKNAEVKVLGPIDVPGVTERSTYLPSFNEKVAVLTPEEMETVLEVIENLVNKERKARLSNGEEKTSGGKFSEVKFHRLSDREKEQIIEEMKKVYEEGMRHNLALYLSGYFAKKRISYEDAIEVILKVAEETGDEELEDRLGAIYSSYAKVYQNEPEITLKVKEKLDELREKGIAKKRIPLSMGSEKDVKGRQGLVELLGEEHPFVRLLDTIISRKVLKSKFGNRHGTEVFDEAEIFVIKESTNSRVYVLNDPKSLGIYVVKERLGRDGNADVTMEKVLDCYAKVTELIPPSVIVTTDEGEEQHLFRKFELQCHTRRGAHKKEVLTFVGDVPTLKTVLKKLGLFIGGANYIQENVLSALTRMAKKEKISLGVPGFLIHYPKNSTEPQLLVEKVNLDEEIDKKKLAEALDAIEQLYERYFHVHDNIIEGVSTFGFLVNWAAIAPFHAILRVTHGIFVPIVVLHGTAGAGKTTLAEVILDMWGAGPKTPPMNRYVKLDRHLLLSSSDVSTQARIERNVLGKTTFPVVLNDVEKVGKKVDVLTDLIKNMTDSNLIISKYDEKQRERRYLALPTTIFTMNDLPDAFTGDVGVKRRSVFFEFTSTISDFSNTSFEEFYARILPKLNYFGQAVAILVKKHFKQLLLSQPDLSKYPDEAKLPVYRSLAFANRIVTLLYHIAGKKKPSWLDQIFPPGELYFEMIKKDNSEVLTALAKLFDITYFYRATQLYSTEPISDNVSEVVPSGKKKDVRKNAFAILSNYKGFLELVKEVADEFGYKDVPREIIALLAFIVDGRAESMIFRSVKGDFNKASEGFIMRNTLLNEIEEVFKAIYISQETKREEFQINFEILRREKATLERMSFRKFASIIADALNLKFGDIYRVKKIEKRPTKVLFFSPRDFVKFLFVLYSRLHPPMSVGIEDESENEPNERDEGSPNDIGEGNKDGNNDMEQSSSPPPLPPPPPPPPPQPQPPKQP